MIEFHLCNVDALMMFSNFAYYYVQIFLINTHLFRVIFSMFLLYVGLSDVCFWFLCALFECVISNCVGCFNKWCVFTSGVFLQMARFYK